MEHIKDILKKKPPQKKKGVKRRQKNGKRGASKRHIVVPAVEEFANQNRFLLDGKLEKNEAKKNKKKAGRPPIVTQDIVRKLEDAFCYDATVEEACLYAGISRQTYYEFLKKYPAFADRIDELRQAPFLVIRKKVVSTAEHDADMGLKFLERKKKQEFSTRTEVAHSGEIVDRHTVDPETAALIKKAMGNFGKKMAKDAARA